MGVHFIQTHHILELHPFQEDLVEALELDFFIVLAHVFEKTLDWEFLGKCFIQFKSLVNLSHIRDYVTFLELLPIRLLHQQLQHVRSAISPQSSNLLYIYISLEFLHVVLMMSMLRVMTHQVLSEPDARIEAASHILINLFSLSHNALHLSRKCI